jgi:hypothetical protein
MTTRSRFPRSFLEKLSEYSLNASASTISKRAPTDCVISVKSLKNVETLLKIPAPFTISWDTTGF